MFEVRVLLDETAKTTLRDLVYIIGREKNLADSPCLVPDKRGHKVQRHRWRMGSIQAAIDAKIMVETLDGVSVTFREA